MENASKALLMAAGILIAILIVTIAVFLFASYSSISESYEETTQTTEIQKFNENFTRYLDRDDVTIQEIVTLYNYIKEYKEKTDGEIEVAITYNGISESDLKNSAEAIKNYQDKKFSVQILSYDSQGRVSSIRISKSN